MKFKKKITWVSLRAEQTVQKKSIRLIEISKVGEH